MPVLRWVVNISEIFISFGNCFPNWTAAWDSKHPPESPSCWITFWLIKERCLQNIDEVSTGWWFGRVIPFLLRAMFTICWRQVSCCAFSSVKEVGYGRESAHRRASRIGQSEFGLEVGGCAWWTVRPTPRREESTGFLIKPRRRFPPRRASPHLPARYLLAPAYPRPPSTDVHVITGTTRFSTFIIFSICYCRVNSYINNLNNTLSQS